MADLIQPQTQQQSAQEDALSSLPYETSSVSEGVIQPTQENDVQQQRYPKQKWRRLAAIALAVVGLAVAIILLSRGFGGPHNSGETASQQLKSQTLQLSSLSQQLTAEQQPTTLTINGQLDVTSSVVLQPAPQPSNAVAGQIYFDQAKKGMLYFNGKQFVALQGGSTTTTITTNIFNTTNQAGSGGSATLNGAAGSLALFTSSNSLGTSVLAQSGSTLNANTNSIKVGTGSGTADIQAAGSEGLDIVTQTEHGSSSAITIQSGDSLTTAAGDVAIDTGTGVINGTVISDRGFEDGLDNFFAGSGSTIAQNCSVAHTGKCSMAITLEGNIWAVGEGEPYIVPVTAGHTYYFSAWIRAGTTGADIDADAVFSTNGLGSYVGGGEYSQNLWGTVTDSSSGWTRVSGAVAAPIGAEYVELIFQGGYQTAFGVHYIDDVTVTDMSSAGGSAVNIGGANAQSVSIGNSNQVGGTNIMSGSAGVNIADATGAITINSTANEVELSGTSVTIGSTGGAGTGVTVETQNAQASSGSITVQSGNSSTTAAGNVAIDTGSGIISGTVISDKTFEDGIDNETAWYGDTIAQSSAEAHDGSHSLAVTFTSSYWGIRENDNFTNLFAQVTPGHNYSFTLWVRAATVPASIGAAVEWNDFPDDDVPLATVTDNTTGWTEISGTGVAPAGTSTATLVFGGASGAVNTVNYFDDIAVTDLSSSSATSEINIGASNAQIVTIGNSHEIGATSILGGSGITINGGLGTVNLDGGSVNLSGSGMSLNTTSGALTITSGKTATWGVGVASSGNGGDLTINAGTAAFGNNNGGNLILQPGIGTGTGIAGDIVLGDATTNTQTSIDGTVLIKPDTSQDSMTAFEVQTAGGAALLTVDTTDTTVIVSGTLHVTGNVTVDGIINANNNVRGINVSVAASATSQAITFGTPYPDSSYAVECTPNFDSSCYVTAKTANGFTINFGTAAPSDGSGTVDWLVVH